MARDEDELLGSGRGSFGDVDYGAPGEPEILDDYPAETNLVDNGATLEVMDEDLTIGDGGDSALQSDWEAENELREQSYRLPDGRLLDEEMDQKTNLEHLQREQLVEEAASVRACPPSWLRSGQEGLLIGDVATAKSGEAPIPVCRWTGDTVEAQMVTVCVSPQQGFNGVFATTNSAANRPYARITWAVRNHDKTIDVDVSKGFSFSVPANAVYVSVGLDTATGGSIGTMQIGASISLGVATSNSTPTRTVYVDLIAGSALNFIVPAFSRALLPPQRTFSSTSAADATPPAATTAFQLDFYDVLGTKIYSLFGADSIYSFASGAIPLSDDVYSVTVLNKSTASPQSAFTVRLIFQLGTA